MVEARKVDVLENIVMGIYIKSVDVSCERREDQQVE
jgi:hypothetical protein